MHWKRTAPKQAEEGVHSNSKAPTKEQAKQEEAEEEEAEEEAHSKKKAPRKEEEEVH